MKSGRYKCLLPIIHANGCFDGIRSRYVPVEDRREYKLFQEVVNKK